MKIVVGSEIGSYTFDKVNKQITLVGLSTITLDKILLIADVTNGFVIYKFNGGASSGGTISSNVITLNYNTNTSDFNNSDQLLIFIDYPHGNPAIISVTPAISTSAYSINDNIGGLQTITNAMKVPNGSAYLMSIMVIDADNEKADIEGYIFESNPTAGTYTDNAQMVIGTDSLKCLGMISIGASSYTTVGTIAVAEVDVKRIMKSAGSNTNLFIAWRVTGTPTYTSTSDLTFRYKFDQSETN